MDRSPIFVVVFIVAAAVIAVGIADTIDAVRAWFLKKDGVAIKVQRWLLRKVNDEK